MANTSQTGADTADARLLSYEDYHPLAELSEDKDHTILTLHLPEFKREQLRITCVRASYKIRIKGERQIANNKWRRFNQVYIIPQNCNLARIEAAFENSVLRIKMPKEDVKVPPVPLAAKEEANMRQEEAPPKAASSSNKMDVQKRVDDDQLSSQKAENKDTGAQKGQDEASPRLPQVASTSSNALDKRAVETKSQAEKVDQSVKELTKKEAISKELSMTPSVDKPEKEGTVRKGKDETSPQLPQVDQSAVSQSGSPEKEKEKEKNNKIVDKEKLCGDKSLKGMKRTKDTAMKLVKGPLMETEEERQMNKIGVGVAALVLVGIVAYVALRIRSKARNN